MSASYLNAQSPGHKRNGLAIASLVLGIVSIPTFGLMGIGALAGLTLGAVALRQVKKDPGNYGGKGMATAGIVTSAISLFMVATFAMFVTIALPKLARGVKRKREMATLNELRSIHNGQMRFKAKNHRFGTIEELADAALIDRLIVAKNSIGGYVYSPSEVSETTFCVQAVRVSAMEGKHDFAICEDGIIRSVESNTPRKVKRGEGSPIDSSFYSTW
jgi:hypothetical protein